MGVIPSRTSPCSSNELLACPVALLDHYGDLSNPAWAPSLEPPAGTRSPDEQHLLHLTLWGSAPGEQKPI